MNNKLITLTGIAVILITISCNTISHKEMAIVEIEAEDVLPISEDTEIIILREVMLAFRKSLSENLLSKASNPLNDKRFTYWHNTPSPINKRQGITYGDLSNELLIKFKTLLQLFLSTEGYQKVNEITVLAEGYLSEIAGDFWNTDFYSIDMFGSPEKNDSWGFQLDGHHCVVNFLVHGNNVSIVPAFLGGEPVKATYKESSYINLKVYSFSCFFST